MIREWLRRHRESRERRQAQRLARLREKWRVTVWFANAEWPPVFERCHALPWLDDFIPAREMAHDRAREIAEHGIWIKDTLVPVSRIMRIKVEKEQEDTKP